MQKNAALASSRTGGLTLVLNEMKRLAAANPNLQLHLVGHSAGSIILGGFAAANQVTAAPLRFETCTMWAPACTMDFYREQYLPAIRGGSIRRFAIFTLTDRAEQDDNCAKIYHKSLLYLVSHALEDVPHVPLMSKGTPILGMETWIREVVNPKSKYHDPAFAKLIGKVDRVLSPNTDAPSTGKGSTASHHGDFDDDDATVKSTLARILGAGASTTRALAATQFTIKHTASTRRERRKEFEAIV
jgi:hypothetical protein